MRQKKITKLLILSFITKYIYTSMFLDLPKMEKPLFLSMLLSEIMHSFWIRHRRHYIWPLNLKTQREQSLKQIISCPSLLLYDDDPWNRNQQVDKMTHSYSWYSFKPSSQLNQCLVYYLFAIYNISLQILVELREMLYTTFLLHNYLTKPTKHDLTSDMY